MRVGSTRSWVWRTRRNNLFLRAELTHKMTRLRFVRFLSVIWARMPTLSPGVTPLETPLSTPCSRHRLAAAARVVSFRLVHGMPRPRVGYEVQCLATSAELQALMRRGELGC